MAKCFRKELPHRILLKLVCYIGGIVKCLKTVQVSLPFLANEQELGSAIFAHQDLEMRCSLHLSFPLLLSEPVY